MRMSRSLTCIQMRITLFGSAGSGTAKVLVTLGQAFVRGHFRRGMVGGADDEVPSSFAAGMAPSGNSFALTYPGVFGSRVGSGGRASLRAFAGAGLSEGCYAGVWAIAAPKPASGRSRTRRCRGIERAKLLSIDLNPHIFKRTWANPTAPDFALNQLRHERPV